MSTVTQRVLFTVPPQAGALAPETLTLGVLLANPASTSNGQVTAFAENEVPGAVIEIWTPSTGGFTYATDLSNAESHTALGSLRSAQLRVRSGGVAGTLSVVGRCETSGRALVIEDPGVESPLIPADRIFVDPNGDDDGYGSAVAPVKTLTKAFTLVTAARKLILLAPGDYAEAAAMTWPTVKGVQVIGAGNSSTSISATGTTLFTVTPGVQSSTWEGHLEGVTVDHSAGAAQSGLTFDNTGMTKKLLFSLKNCAFSAAASTDKSLDVKTHGDANNGIRIYIEGDGTQQEIEGAIYFLVKNNGDRLNIDQCWLRGVITTSADDKPVNIRLRRCVVPHGAATAGGHSSQKITAVSCYAWTDFSNDTAETYAALDTADLAGSHAEVIVA